MDHQAVETNPFGHQATAQYLSTLGRLAKVVSSRFRRFTCRLVAQSHHRDNSTTPQNSSLPGLIWIFAGCGITRSSIGGSAMRQVFGRVLCHESQVLRSSSTTTQGRFRDRWHPRCPARALLARCHGTGRSLIRDGRDLDGQGRTRPLGKVTLEGTGIGGGRKVAKRNSEETVGALGVVPTQAAESRRALGDAMCSLCFKRNAPYRMRVVDRAHPPFINSLVDCLDIGPRRAQQPLAQQTQRTAPRLPGPCACRAS
ncbi:hypothetical protein HYQ46_008644 [Verticillium longisporum]|nr:hypothetical protein HYQ46_008644 [Verticillium longisporum]